MSDRIELIRLTERNFKGITEFTLDAQGHNVRIYGNNATGKTTQFDAFTWLLFDKDSQNKKDFEIKTLDQHNQVIKGLEHEVEGVLRINGRDRKLRKVYSEKWTKKRGSAKAEFTGHETSYFIDDVPYDKKSDYEQFVAGIMSEEVFKLLTNPTYFNEVWDWKKRRKLLLEICGDVSNRDVISSNESLSELLQILGERSIEEHRSMIKGKQKSINDELKDIPIRINEATRSKPDMTDLVEQVIDDKIVTLNGRIQEKESELVRIQSGGEVAVKEKRLREIEGELQQLKNDLQGVTLDKIAAKRREVADLEQQADAIQSEKTKLASKIKFNDTVIVEKTSEASRLREQWTSINEAPIAIEHTNDSCPACKQSLPEDQVKAAHDKAVSDANLRKSEQLESISAKGKSAMSEARRLEAENQQLREEYQAKSDALVAKSGVANTAKEEMAKIQSNVQDVSADPAYMSKQQEANSVKEEINSLRSSAQETVDKLKFEIADVRTGVAALAQNKAKFAQAKTLDDRINQLKQDEKKLAAEYERLEQELFLTEEFIRTKVSMLESKFNSKFKYAKFKLFKPLVNGAVEECCDATYNGVPFSTGLNSGAQTNTGLDIINTLSEHYDISAPIFIDNAESVTKLIPTNGQQIQLVVSEQDKKLRVELADEGEVFNKELDAVVHALKNDKEAM